MPSKPKNEKLAPWADGLIFLRYSDFPENTLRSIVRGLPDELQERIWLRFYGRKPAEA